MMYVNGVRFREAAATATDRHYWSLHDLPEYEPGHKPPIEFGKLVDDMGLLAQLRTDVSEVLKRPESDPSSEAEASQCLAIAKILAARIGGFVVRQTSLVVVMRLPAFQEMSLGCRMPRPHLFAAWDKSAAPSPFLPRTGVSLALEKRESPGRYRAAGALVLPLVTRTFQLYCDLESPQAPSD